MGVYFLPIISALQCCRKLLLAEAAVAVVAFLGIPGSLFVQFLGLLGEGKLQGGVAVLAHEELLEVAGGHLGIQREGVLPFLLQPGIIAVKVPVNC